LRFIAEPLTMFCGTLVWKRCSKQMLWQFMKGGSPSEQAGWSTYASVLYGVGTRFGSRSGPRLSWLRFLLPLFSSSGQIQANYFTLGNVRVFQTISYLLFTSHYVFGRYKACDAENAGMSTKEQTFCAELLLRRYRRSGCINFPKHLGSASPILGMKQVLYWGPTNIKHQHTKFARRGDMASRICAPFSKAVNGRAADCRAAVAGEAVCFFFLLLIMTS
jgi:hypothetical protein